MSLSKVDVGPSRSVAYDPAAIGGKMRAIALFGLIFSFSLGTGSGPAYAQADVGLVNMVAGEATFTPQGGKPGKVTAFMKVREQDRFDVRPGAQVRIVYFESARQERWQGPSSFSVAKTQGASI